MQQVAKTYNNYPDYPARKVITTHGGQVSEEMPWKRREQKAYADDFYVAMTTFKQKILLFIGDVL
jgi:hypothetical protein